MPTICFGLTPRNKAVTSVARKHAVPDALSQLNVKTAAYGAGRPVTGGIRVIALCSQGTLMPLTAAFFQGAAGSSEFVHASMRALIDGSPHASTKTTSIRYGSQAMKSSPAE